MAANIFFANFSLSPVIHVVDPEYPIDLRIIETQIFYIKCSVRPESLIFG